MKNLIEHYEESISKAQCVDIGVTTKPVSLHENEDPPMALGDYVVSYPRSLISAYKIACERYDQQFQGHVKRHKISDSDYQYAPHTLAFQVDGPAYPDTFLNNVEFADPAVLADFIVVRAFEFESNIAAYGLNGRLWPDGTTNSTWHATLDTVRQNSGKKVAVLTGTEQKLDETLMYEMGATRDQMPSAEQIRDMTGFDAFLGPADAHKLYAADSQNCPFVFFGRTSRPKSWLKDPKGNPDNWVWDEPGFLKFVRAHAITHNFDKPYLHATDPSVMLDSKVALVDLGGAYLIKKPSDIYSPEFMCLLKTNGITEDKIISWDLSPKMKNRLNEFLAKFSSQKRRKFRWQTFTPPFL